MRFCRANGGHRVPLGTPWGSEADCERLWGWLRHHFGACRLRFSIDCLEKCDFAISTPLSSGMAAFASPDTKLDAPGPKSHADEAVWTIKTSWEKQVGPAKHILLYASAWICKLRHIETARTLKISPWKLVFS